MTFGGEDGVPFGHTLLLLMALLVVALLLEPIARRLRLPFAAALVVAGFIGSELFLRTIGDTGLRWYHFHDLILYVLVPVLIFASALKLDPRALREQLTPILALSLPFQLASVFLVAALVYWGIGHPEGFPWMAALITATLLSLTDPSPVLAKLRKQGAPSRVPTLLEGESLFADVTGIVLFALLTSLAAQQVVELTLANTAGHFLLAFFGGLFVGFIVGLSALGLLRIYTGDVHGKLITVIACFFSIYLAQEVLHTSTAASVLACGLAIRRRSQRQTGFNVNDLWGFLSYVASALLFLLMGVTITVEMFSERWLAMGIGICATFLARAVMMYLLFPAMAKLPACEYLPLGERRILIWGGLRGAVSIALALSLSVQLEGWWTIQSIAYGVVLFTLLVQAPTLPFVVRTSGVVLNPRSSGGTE